MFVIGRWGYHMCRLALPRKLEPCDELKAEVDEAVGINNIEQRREALKRVFGHWGDRFVAEVEMGGTKYGRIEKTTSSKVLADKPVVPGISDTIERIELRERVRGTHEGCGRCKLQNGVWRSFGCRRTRDVTKGRGEANG
jgi:hypothetical protein